MPDEGSANRERRRRPPTGQELLRPSTISEALQDPDMRRSLDLADDETTPMAVVVELNLLHESGLEGAEKRFKRLFAELPGTRATMRSKSSCAREVACERLTGVAPQCKIVSLKVLDKNGTSRSTDVLKALQYVREKLNGNGKLLRVHGVNLSVGYEFDAKWFACGQSPICVEVDRLVQSGPVVVVAAGNTGYGEPSANQRFTNTGLTLTINDPGNADLAITVGATHRDSPHTYGVSYFSSKGPTGDGRPAERRAQRHHPP